MIDLESVPSPSPADIKAAEVARNAGLTSIKDTVIVIVTVLAVVAVCWFVAKALAKHPESRAAWLYRRLDPTVQAMREWMARSPVTFVYIATWTVTSVIFQGVPAELANVFSRFESTNILGIVTEPLRVLFSSAFIVADNGYAFLFYVAVYVLITARLEQRIGSARVIIVGAAAHVLGSLLTVLMETVLIHTHVLPVGDALTTDVGVSYVMVGTCGGYLLFIASKWRWWYYAAMFVGLVLPLIVIHDIWSLGHFNATIIGLLTTLIVRRWGVRPPLLWRDAVAAAAPRPLPTWAPSSP